MKRDVFTATMSAGHESVSLAWLGEQSYNAKELSALITQLGALREAMRPEVPQVPPRNMVPERDMATAVAWLEASEDPTLFIRSQRYGWMAGTISADGAKRLAKALSTRSVPRHPLQ